MAASFSVGDRRYGSGKALVVAEIGTGHGGDLAKARELIAAAAESGADCVKFQCVFADEIIHPNTGLVPLPGGSIALYDRFLELEEDEDFYAAAKECAESRGLVFLCTPFGLRSARLLRRIGCEAMKVASPELNHFPFSTSWLPTACPSSSRAGSPRWPTSTAPSAAFGRLAGARRRRSSDSPSSTASPPTPPRPRSTTSALLTSLGSLFGLPVGVSDHSLDPVLVPALSIAAGGIIVEKHICLSRDDRASTTPSPSRRSASPR